MYDEINLIQMALLPSNWPEYNIILIVCFLKHPPAKNKPTELNVVVVVSSHRLEG